MARRLWEIAERRLARSLKRSGEPVLLSPADDIPVRTHGFFEEQSEESGFEAGRVKAVTKTLLINATDARAVKENTFIVLEDSDERVRVVDVVNTSRVSRTLYLKVA